MFKEMKKWNWTPRAYELWADIKFLFWAVVVTALVVIADWVGRTWLH